MFKRLDPSDIRITPFKAYKEFTVANTDSGSNVYNFRAISGSTFNFSTSSADVTTYPSTSFYHLPSWFLINNLYYKQKDGGTMRSFQQINPFDNFGGNSDKQFRFLHTSASVISIPISWNLRVLSPKLSANSPKPCLKPRPAIPASKARSVNI